MPRASTDASTILRPAGRAAASGRPAVTARRGSWKAGRARSPSSCTSSFGLIRSRIDEDGGPRTARESRPRSETPRRAREASIGEVQRFLADVFGRRPRSALCRRSRRDVAAAAAGAMGLGTVELLVRARDRILAVVGHVLDALVKLRAALGAVPREPVVLVGPTLPLEDEHERLRREPGRVGGAGGAIDDLALADHRHLLVAGGGPVVQLHLALDHVHDLVARIAVELAPELATSRDEGDAVGRLPQDRVGPARAANARHDLSQAARLQLVHDENLLSTRGADWPGARPRRACEASPT